MKKKIFITEKPSVASSFAEILGIKIKKNDRANGYFESNEYIVTWCFGHLITMAYPDAYDERYRQWKVEDLPIIPCEYKYIIIDNDGVKKQYETIKFLFEREDVEEIYVCTDSGREGEYIFRLVNMMIGVNKPAKRVWISSQTEEAIKEGIEKAKDISCYDSLAKAAYSRAKEDWLFGMNFSRAYTCLYGSRLSALVKEKKPSVIAVGRVMTCVLGLVVERENEIRNFVPKVNYSVSAEMFCERLNLSFICKFKKISEINEEVENKPEEDETSSLTREEAEKVIEKLNGKKAEVKRVEKKIKNDHPPLLFNLAELQSECSKKYKLSVEKTLEIAQSLYEKKLITYPRTDCRVISQDVYSELRKILAGLGKNSAFSSYIEEIKKEGELRVKKNTKRFVDDSKVTDHYAIIPTYVTFDLNKMTEDERKVYSLIVKRFIAIFFPPAKYSNIRIETKIEDELFVTTAKTLIDPGWKLVYEISTKENGELTGSEGIENLKKGDICDVKGFKLDENKTKPPSRYTDGSLIITMEKAGKFIEDEELRETIKTCGIGTSATRAGIIKKLDNIGYIEINKKTRIVRPTLKGEGIVELIKRTAKELLNPAFTASWEKGLVMIENSETSEEIFLEKLDNYIKKTVSKIKNSDGNINLINIFSNRF